MDDPAISDQDVHARIVERSGMDKNVPLEYTTITRQLFNIVADHYKLERCKPSDIPRLISATIKALEKPRDLEWRLEHGPNPEPPRLPTPPGTE